MSLRSEDREAEAKYQVATEAGLTVPDYSEKVGKDVFRKQAKDLVRQRVIEDQKEGEELFKELYHEPSQALKTFAALVTETPQEEDQQPSSVLETTEAPVTELQHEEDQQSIPVLETSGALVTATDNEKPNTFDRDAGLANVKPETVHEVDKQRKKPHTKNYDGSVKKLDYMKTSFLGDTDGLGQDVHGTDYVQVPKIEGRKRRYEPEFGKVSTEVASLTSNNDAAIRCRGQ
jgi:hypothetical protein